MISYKALSRASITLQKIEENSSYSCEIFSSNGSILQPYDINTTLTGVVYDNFKDITKEINSEDIKWTIWDERIDEAFKKDWNNSHIGKNPITISCDEINGKAIIQFEVYKTNKFGLKELITCNRITLIDINDLITTTTKPTNPYENQLWVDTNVVPATIMIWQKNKWNIIGTVTTIIKNLIRNSNFINYCYEPFIVVGNIKNQYDPTVKTVSGRKWLNIKSDTLSIEDKGISQITEDSEVINKKSKYSFQFLAYSSFETTSYNNSIEVKISSINEYNVETILYYNNSINKEIVLNKNICKFFTSFTTLSDTKKIKIEILGKPNSRYDFNITQLALYNTENDYPWQAHPDDTSSILDTIQNKPNYRLDVYVPDGTVIRSAGNSTIAYARVYNWDKEITNDIDESKFNWYRRSKDKNGDYYWNSEHGRGRKSIVITTDDILSYATFYFTVDI